MLRSSIVALVVVIVAACGGGGSGGGAASSPLGATENALMLASRGEALGFAKTLASGPRGASTADIQLEILSEWLHERALPGTRIAGGVLDGWDQLRLEGSTGSTATVTTVLRFRQPSAEPPERPVPLQVDLVREGGAWRIADARVKPLPAWYKAKHEEEHPAMPGETPEPVPQPPTLAEIAATYRPPPPDFKR